jgi:hypothetical protein
MVCRLEFGNLSSDIAEVRHLKCLASTSERQLGGCGVRESVRPWCRLVLVCGGGRERQDLRGFGPASAAAAAVCGGAHVHGGDCPPPCVRVTPPANPLLQCCTHRASPCMLCTSRGCILSFTSASLQICCSLHCFAVHRATMMCVTMLHGVTWVHLITAPGHGGRRDDERGAGGAAAPGAAAQR